MRDSLKIRFCSYSILFIARYADALPSLPFPLQPLYETGVCDFTWYTSPQTGNPLYGLANVDGVLSHAASGHCVSKGRPTCKGFTVFPPSWQTGRCPDEGGSQVPCCIQGAACVQADFKVTLSMKKGVCQDIDLPCESGEKVASDDCPYDDRYDTQTTCCLPHESFQQYIHIMSSNSQSPDSNLADATDAVSLPPTSGDDQIDGIATSLLTTPEQTPANTPGGVYSFPMYEAFAGFSDPMDLNQQASTGLV